MKRLLFLALFVSAVFQACVPLELRPTKRVEPLVFDIETPDTAFRQLQPYSAEIDIYRSLREEANLDSVLSDTSTSLDRLLALNDYVFQLASGKTKARAVTSNAFDTFLDLREGKNIAEGEEAYLLTAMLQATGMQARTVFLMTNDAEVTKRKAGHYITEVWIPEQQRWAMADPRFNLVPMIGEFVLNAVDFQASIINNRPYRFVSKSGEFSEKERVAYLRFIPHLLFYFASALDQRIAPDVPHAFGEYAYMLLVPVEVEIPEYFQRTVSLKDYFVVHNRNTFYQAPVASESLQ